MKKVLKLIILILSLCLISIPASMTVFAASLSDNAVITLSGEITEHEVVVKANLRQNTGINGMTVEISYNTSAMTLTNVERGSALPLLDYMTTNVETEKGYAITPFKINWSGDENDNSTGVLVTMHFTVNETANDGEYAVTLITDKESITYIDGGVKTKSALIDGVRITIKGSSAETIVPDTTPNTNNTSPIILIISLSVAAVAIVTFTVLLMKRLKGKKAWTKIE